MPLDPAITAFFVTPSEASLDGAQSRLRELEAGEVTVPEDLSPSGRPSRGGTLCERLFGPTRDLRCLCGYLDGVSVEGEVCRKCGVLCGDSALREVTWAHVATPIALRLQCDDAELQIPAGALIPVTPPRTGRRLDERQRPGVDSALYNAFVGQASRYRRLLELQAPAPLVEIEAANLQDQFSELHATVAESLGGPRSKRRAPVAQRWETEGAPEAEHGFDEADGVAVVRYCGADHVAVLCAGETLLVSLADGGVLGRWDTPNLTLEYGHGGVLVFERWGACFALDTASGQWLDEVPTRVPAGRVDFVAPESPALFDHRSGRIRPAWEAGTCRELPVYSIDLRHVWLADKDGASHIYDLETQHRVAAFHHADIAPDGVVKLGLEGKAEAIPDFEEREFEEFEHENTQDAPALAGTAAGARWRTHARGWICDDGVPFMLIVAPIQAACFDSSGERILLATANELVEVSLEREAPRIVRRVGRNWPERRR